MFVFGNGYARYKKTNREAVRLERFGVVGFCAGFDIFLKALELGALSDAFFSKKIFAVAQGGAKSRYVPDSEFAFWLALAAFHQIEHFPITNFYHIVKHNFSISDFNVFDVRIALAKRDEIIHYHLV